MYKDKEVKNDKKNFFIIALSVAFVSFTYGIATALDPTQLQPKILKPVATRAEYTIKGGDFYYEAQNYGFNTKAHSLSTGSMCSQKYFRDANNNYVRLLVLPGSISFVPVGSKCDFTVFESATLKNGFVFKRFTGQRIVHHNADMSLTSSPPVGSTSVKFTFHGWCQNGTNDAAQYLLYTITLEGPSGRDWRDALR